MNIHENCHLGILFVNVIDDKNKIIHHPPITPVAGSALETIRASTAFFAPVLNP